MVIKITPLNQYFPLVEKYGMTIGILILTVGVMTPIATGRISAQEVFNSFLNWKSLLAIAIGIIVSWLGARGVSLMNNQPSTVAGLLVGTVIGVALFRGFQ